MEVKKKDYGMENTILYNLDPYVGKSITIDDSEVEEDENGKKIVKAGSIVDKEGKIVSDDTARYIVLQNVDVTAGPRSATGIYRGTVDVSKMPVAPTADVISAISGITFMKNDSDYKA